MTTDPGQVVIVVTDNSTGQQQVGTVPADPEAAQEFCAKHDTPEVSVTTRPA